ncbi:MAG: hypothetical protein CMN98_00950 [Synechococcus sp. NP17]|nr:hypothetical protein [Synechococcus sp. NP17]
MASCFKRLSSHLLNIALMLCLGFGLLVTACANNGIALSDNAEIASASLELGEFAQGQTDMDSLDDLPDL